MAVVYFAGLEMAREPFCPQGPACHSGYLREMLEKMWGYSFLWDLNLSSFVPVLRGFPFLLAEVVGEQAGRDVSPRAPVSL